MKKFNRIGMQMSAAFFTGVMTSHSAHATAFNDIADNVVGSISDLPGLLSAISYMFGILIGTLGVLKIKDHVENPSNTPLKDGAIRLAAGGGLFALPIVYDAMHTTVGTGTATTSSAMLEKIQMGVQ